jgi:Fic family protein
VRVPQTAPGWVEVFGKPEELSQLLSKFSAQAVQEFLRQMNEKYIHWDKLRYQKFPEGLTAKMAWASIKMTRGTQLRFLPLTFHGNEKLSYYVTMQQLEWLHDIDKQGGGDIGILTNEFPDDNERYLYNSLMEEAIASSQLEGASTTRPIAKEMLRSNRQPSTKAERMILNNYLAILEVRELKKEPLTPELLCHLQKVLTDGTLDNRPDAAGRFRKREESVYVEDSRTGDIIYRPPAAEEITDRIKELCDFANEITKPFVHPVVKAAILHFALGFIHPFVDGNGRTARALFYWYMLKRNYWLFEYFPISRVLIRSPAKYARAYLYTETDGGDTTYFVRFHIKAILDAISSFRQYVVNEAREVDAALKLLDSFPQLNYRQRLVLQEFLKHPGKGITIRSHQGKFHITDPTARSDLTKLVNMGLLSIAKRGRTPVFFAQEDLRKRLHLPAKAQKIEKQKIPDPIAVTTVKQADEASTEESPSKQRSLFD